MNHADVAGVEGEVVRKDVIQHQQPNFYNFKLTNYARYSLLLYCKGVDRLVSRRGTKTYTV